MSWRNFYSLYCTGLLGGCLFVLVLPDQILFSKTRWIWILKFASLKALIPPHPALFPSASLSSAGSRALTFSPCLWNEGHPHFTLQPCCPREPPHIHVKKKNEESVTAAGFDQERSLLSRGSETWGRNRLFYFVIWSTSCLATLWLYCISAQWKKCWHHDPRADARSNTCNTQFRLFFYYYLLCTFYLFYPCYIIQTVISKHAAQQPWEYAEALASPVLVKTSWHLTTSFPACTGPEQRLIQQHAKKAESGCSRSVTVSVVSISAWFTGHRRP